VSQIRKNNNISIISAEDYYNVLKKEWDMRWKKIVGKRNVSVRTKHGIFKRKVCEEKLSVV